MLIGPRQVGKTTLAQEIARKENSVYLDLESQEDLLKLRDPLSFLSANSEKLIILDEIHRVAGLFMILRGVIDENRRRTRQFLLLGSATMDLLFQSSQSPAGRIRYVFMSGFNILETPHADSHALNKLWLRVGFPRQLSCLIRLGEHGMA